MKKAIIIGASSGIGKEMASILSKNGYQLVLAGRRIELLQTIAQQLPNPAQALQMDITRVEECVASLNAMFGELRKTDLVLICSGIGHLNNHLDWALEKETIDVNVMGVTSLINACFHQFKTQNSGHLVVISSLAALRGGAESPAYNASKAFLSNYMEGLRCHIRKNKLPIFTTDVMPGLVDTAMAKGEGLFWVEPVEKACKQLYACIVKRKKKCVITHRWKLIGFLLKRLPERFLP